MSRDGTTADAWSAVSQEILRENSVLNPIEVTQLNYNALPTRVIGKHSVGDLVRDSFRHTVQ